MTEIPDNLVPLLREKHCHCRWTGVDMRDVCISCVAANVIESLQSELERERKRADGYQSQTAAHWKLLQATQSRLDAIEAMAREQLVWLRPVKAGIANQGTESDLLDLLHALILDGKEKL